MRDRFVKHRGVALIVVLTGVAILAAFSTEFSYRSRVDIRVGTNLEKQVQAYFHARSSMEIVRLVVTSQKFVDQAVAAFGGGGAAKGLELWRFACKFVEIFNTANLNVLGIDLVTLKGVEGIGVEKGGFSCEIVPEDAKVNVNSAKNITEKKALFARLYPMFRGVVDPDTRGGDEDRKAAELILNIIDWVDPDDNRSDIDSSGTFVESGGAGENVNYSRWGYEARNAKMDSVEELRLIDGMTDELFCRFGKELTVYNTDKVNVNEAELTLLKAMVCDNLVPGSDPNFVCGLLADEGVFPIDEALALMNVCRELKRSLYTPGFSSEDDFLQFFGRLPAPLNQIIQINSGALKPLIGVRSKVLRVKSAGWVAGSGYAITAVIDTASMNYVHWKESGFDATSDRTF